MRIDFFILLITGFIVLNIYHDGKYIEELKKWKKYYHMMFYGFLGLSLYIFIKKFPDDGKSLLTHANTFVKYMPMDKNSADLISPILSASSKFTNYNNYGNNYGNNRGQYNRMMSSGGSPIPSNNIQNSNISTQQSTKRSVSETKKKFVAANQNWKCAKCSTQLPAWFEVDHKIRLDRGGDNHVNNLEALCRNCHGKKTAMETML